MISSVIPIRSASDQQMISSANVQKRIRSVIQITLAPGQFSTRSVRLELEFYCFQFFICLDDFALQAGFE